MEYSILHNSFPITVSTTNVSMDSTSSTITTNDHYRVSTESFECSYINNLTFQNGSVWIIKESLEQQDEVRRICRSVTILADAFFWLAVTLGIPGNLSAMATLATMPKSTGTFYIALLAGLDFNAIILKTIGRFLNTEGVRLGDFGCKILMVTTNFIVTFANWTLVLVCLERFVTIRFPLKKPVYFTIKRARYSALCLGCCLFPFFAVLFFIYEESPPGSSRPCRTSPDLQEFSREWNQLISILYSSLPSVLLFLHVGLIAAALRQHRKRRESIMGSSSSQDKITLRVTTTGTRNAVQTHRVNQRQQMDKLERSVTGMSLMAAIVFIVLTLPVCVMMIVTYDKSKDSPTFYAQWTLIVTVARALVLMSHALNCYIYFLTCKKFRNHFFNGITKIFVKLPKTRGQSATATTRVQVTEITPWNNQVRMDDALHF